MNSGSAVRNEHNPNKTMRNHLIDVTIPAEALAALAASTTTLSQTVAGFAISLDPAQRVDHARLGFRNETFARSVLDLANQKPEIVPATIDVTAVQRDLLAREQLLPVLLQLKSVTQLVEDTTIALGIDIFESARGIYMSAKVTSGISGTSTVLKEIGRRFEGIGRKKKPATEPTPTTPPPPTGATGTSGTSSGTDNDNGTVIPTL
jgi:hypothetical protein